MLKAVRFPGRDGECIWTNSSFLVPAVKTSNGYDLFQFVDNFVEFPRGKMNYKEEGWVMSSMWKKEFA